MYTRGAAVLVAALVMAACGDATDGPREGETQVVPPAQPPSVQQPHYDPQAPVQDTVRGPMSPEQQTGGAPGGGTGGPGQGPGVQRN
jgi:hypothetical protein